MTDPDARSSQFRPSLRCRIRRSPSAGVWRAGRPSSCSWSVLTTIAALLWPVIKAIARRIEAGGAAADARGELEELRERVRQLEQANPRLAELEERLDFAERLLAQQEPDRLKR